MSLERNMTSEEQAKPVEYLSMLKRRKGVVLAATLVVAVLAIAAAVLWPATYRSEATILIEEAGVPDELVRSTVSTFADERLQVIQQRVIATQNLIGVINKFNLYKEARKSRPMAVVVEDMREKIGLQVISADVNDPKSGRTSRATIAFTVSFEDSEPITAQQVANELVTLYLSENIQSRQQQAAGTTGFLSAESQKLYGRIQELETQIADFKAKNTGALPEQAVINAQILDRAQTELMSIHQQLQAAEERRILLQGQLAQVSPYSNRVVNGQAVLNPSERLQLLQTEYLSKSARYGESHPDVVALKREIGGLNASDSGISDNAALRERAEELNGELAAARKKYGAKHPEVKRLTREIASLKTAIAESRRDGGSSAMADNPAYVQVQAQIAATDSDISSLRVQGAAVSAKIAALEQRVLAAPEVERVFLSLKREYDSTLLKYEEIRAKEGEARLAESLEAGSKGERFSVIEPPELPEEPVRPNRKMILAIGLILALAAGIGGGALADALDSRVYGTRPVAGLIGQVPLVTVPRIRNRAEVRGARLAWALGATAVAAAIMAPLAYVHFRVMPLSEAAASLANRLSLGQ